MSTYYRKAQISCVGLMILLTLGNHEACLSAASESPSGPLSFEQPPVHIKVLRRAFSDECTMGYVAVENRVLAYTLEPPWVDNESHFSAIPPGRYKGTIRLSPEAVRRNAKDQWRVTLNPITSSGITRTEIEFHIGQSVANTEGCILLGRGADADSCRLLDSGSAYADFMRAVVGTSPNSAVAGQPVVVEVGGNFPTGRKTEVIVGKYQSNVNGDATVKIPVKLVFHPSNMNPIALPNRTVEFYVDEPHLGVAKDGKTAVIRRRVRPISTQRTDNLGNTTFSYEVKMDLLKDSKGRPHSYYVDLLIFFRANGGYSASHQNRKTRISMVARAAHAEK